MGFFKNAAWLGAPARVEVVSDLVEVLLWSSELSGAEIAPNHDHCEDEAEESELSVSENSLELP